MGKRIPATNNMGGARKRLSSEEILTRADYPFHGGVLKKFMSPAEYKELVHKYAEYRGRAMFFEPSKDDLAAFQQYKKGILDINSLAAALKIPNTYRVYVRIGRLYEYEKSSRRNSSKA